MKLLSIAFAVVVQLIATASAEAAPQPFNPATACRPAPTPTVRMPPRYPQDQVDAHGDGWVQFLLTVDPDGRVKKAEIVDSVGADSFRDAARRAVLQWRYEPDGNPGDLRSVPALITFVIDYPKISSLPLAEAILRAKALKGDDKRGERMALMEAVRPLPMTNRDRLLLSLVLSLGSKEQGDLVSALHHIRHATVEGDRQIEKALAAQVLRIRADLEAADGNLHGAVCMNEKARELSPPSAAHARFEKMAADALARLNDATPLTLQGTVSAQAESELPPAWTHTLDRKAFTLKPLSGAIDKVRLACPLSASEKLWVADEVWEVGAPPGNCTVYVFGSPGTKVELTETW